MVLRLMMSGRSRFLAAVVTSVGIMGAWMGAASAQAQDTKLGPAAPVTYTNRYEVYGGLNLMNFQAGQNLPKRMNFGGAEVMGTYWLTNHLGIAADYRGEAGTTPVSPNPYNVNRPLVYMNMGMAGVQYRGPKNHYAAIDYHALFGVADGVFDAGTQGGGTVTSATPSQIATAVGLYSNRTKPIGAVGGSVDFNWSRNLAIRVQPDLILEHFGTETREFVAFSGGVIYRFGKR
jgi:hypothetical protein